MPELTVVTVLYRSREMLGTTLPTWVRSAADRPVDFVFVDHCPQDGCESLIAQFLPADRYRYLANADNPGFAAGANAGVRAATSPHVLLLNPDVTLPEGALGAILAEIAVRPAQPIAVGLAMAGSDHGGIDLHPISLFIDRRAGARRGPLGPSGGAAVFPVEVYQRFEGLYEPMFAWGEDADLALRMYAAGVRTAEFDLALPHAWGHSVAGNSTLVQRRAYLLARNRVLVAFRTLSWPLLLVGAPLAVAAHAVLAVRRIRQGTLRPFLAGVGRGLVGGVRARRAMRTRRFGMRELMGYLRTEERSG